MGSETMSWPIIVIGMHRSGTSMVARFMEQMGVFMGVQQDINAEANFFRLLNRWMFYQSGASWDQPDPVRYLIENTEVRSLVTDYLRYLLGTRHAVNYLGWRKYLRYRSIEKLDIPWGWKDPSNTYTLPLWLDVFPNARVVHVLRHGVDVANSLVTREREFLVAARELHARRKKRHEYWFRMKEFGFVSSLRCFSLEEGFFLWKEYVLQAREYLSQLVDSSFEVRYEDILHRPVRTLHTLSEFCGVQVPESAIQEIACKVDPTRAYVYRNSPQLVAFASMMRDQLSHLGYQSVEPRQTEPKGEDAA